MKTEIKVILISVVGIVLATIIGTILWWFDPHKNDLGSKDSGNKDYSETMDIFRTNDATSVGRIQQFQSKQNHSKT